MNLNLNYIPLLAQRRLHESGKKFRLYSGGFGSGKSLSVCAELLILCIESPGILAVICRKTYPELRDTTMRTFFDFCPPEIIKSYNKHEHHLVLINGSEILFRSLDSPEKLKMELGVFLIDEASEVEEEYFLMLKGRLRQKNVKRRCGLLASNPTTREHWLYKTFVIHTAIESSEDYAYFKASTLDNPHLPKDYVKSLLDNYPPEWIDRFVRGNFGYLSSSNKIFPPFAEDLHVRPQRTIEGKTIFRGWDFGYRHPGVVWVQFDSQDRFRVLQEYLGTNLTTPRFAEEILRMSDRDFPNGNFTDYCDPAGTHRNSKSELTDIQILSSMGINTSYRRTSVADGLKTLRRKMERSREGRMEFQVDPRCRLLIEALLGGYHAVKTREGQVLKDKPFEDGYFENIVDPLRYVAVNTMDLRDLEVAKPWVRKPKYTPFFEEVGY